MVEFLKLILAAVGIVSMIVIVLLIVDPQGQKAAQNKALQFASNNSQQCAPIIMYSLTTCGFCTIKRREMKSQSVTFTEYYIDKDSSKDRELQRKAHKQKLSRYGFPTFEINGKLVRNTSVDNLLKLTCQNT